MKNKIMLKCPLCERKAYKGQLSALSFGVKCGFCGLSIEKEIPHENPHLKTIEEIDKETLDKCIEKWKKLVVA